MSIAFAEVIGQPVSQSLSPLIHEHWLRLLGLEGCFVKMEVQPQALREYLEARRNDPDWRGCSVTIPHKEKVLPLLDSLSPAAAEIGAVNCIHRSENGLKGSNTDVAGIAATLGGVNLDGEVAAVIGGGGAARAALHYLVGAGCRTIRLILRNPAKAAPLDTLAQGRLRACSITGAGKALSGAKLIINASPLGMEGSPPMPQSILDHVAQIGSDPVVFDMVYRPSETALLAAARRGGGQILGGLSMLVGQARTAFELFYHAPAPEGIEALPPELLASLQGVALGSVS